MDFVAGRLERGIWEAAPWLCDHGANGAYWAQHLMKGALLDPRLAPRKGFSENSLAALPRESASERTILRSSGTFDPLHEFDQWSNLAGTVNGRNRCLLEP